MSENQKYQFRWERSTMDDYRDCANVRAQKLRREAEILISRAEQIEMELCEIMSALIEAKE